MKKIISTKTIINVCGYFILLLSFTACQKVNEFVEKVKDNHEKNDIPGIIFYALHGNKLDKFSTSNPEKVIGSATITGMQEGEMILGLDFRPATGELYALGSQNRLYVINPSSGSGKFIASLTTIPMGSMTGVPLSLSGSSFGFDFNPVVDRIRIISNTGQNLRVNPTTGVTLVDGPINPQPAWINGAAYDNNDTDTTTSTELYVLDVTGDKLFEVDPPNNGTLIEPLSLDLSITGDGGFDIAPRNETVKEDIGLAIYEINKVSTLFRIDVETGKTKILGYYKGTSYSAIAISSSR